MHTGLSRRTEIKRKMLQFISFTVVVAVVVVVVIDIVEDGCSC